MAHSHRLGQVRLEVDQADVQRHYSIRVTVLERFQISNKN